MYVWHILSRWKIGLSESSYANGYCTRPWGNQGYWISLRQLKSSMSEAVGLRVKAYPWFKLPCANQDKYSAEKKRDDFTITSPSSQSMFQSKRAVMIIFNWLECHNNVIQKYRATHNNLHINIKKLHYIVIKCYIE